MNDIATISPIPNDNIKPSAFKEILLRVTAKLQKKDADKMSLGYKHSIYGKCDVALSVGGDNYCYPGMQHVMSEHTFAIDYWHKPAILWGCSLDRELLSPKVIGELSKYKTIIARESITYETLQDFGFGHKVHIASDPAFLLPVQHTEWPDKKLNGKKIIGVNISPLINRYNEGNLILKNYYHLINYLLQDDDVFVALIPHVEQLNNDDFSTAIRLCNLVNSERVTVIPNGYNCMQLKSLISQCYNFIGARTHATIAAYSTKVPTLVVGYSTKSKGIARDIFGSENGLVIPVQDITSEYSLVKQYAAFEENRPGILSQLQIIIDNYANKAFIARDILEEQYCK